MGIRDLYADKFGEKEAEKLYLSALFHKDRNEVDPPPDIEEDPFIWAILVAIDKQCVERFSDYHEINITYKDFKQFCLEHSEILLSYKGKLTSYLGFLSGCFNFLIGEKGFNDQNEKVRKRKGKRKRFMKKKKRLKELKRFKKRRES